MDLEELERRVQVLEDIEAIKKLKALYCLYCDDNFNADALVGLFATDAVWEGDDLGRHQGHEAIRSFYKAIVRRLTFAIHYVANPVIQVQGDRAHGTWYLLEPGTIENNQAIWIMGRYTDDYIKVDGRWLFSKVTLNIMVRTPYEDGWAKQRLR